MDDSAFQDSASIDQALSAPQDDFEQSANKRKRTGDGTGTRSKRNRYISIACNECKRRKIKCNGEHPCQRCGNLQLECVYAPNCCSNNFKETIEYKHMNAQVQSLQEQVNTLWQSINSLRSALGHEIVPQPDTFTLNEDNERLIQPAQASMLIDPALGPNQGSPRQSKYQGPTSAQYNFDLARSSLQSMGITTNDDDPEDAVAKQPDNNAANVSQGRPIQLHPSVAVVREISKDEALRLCQVYKEEMDPMYPILDIHRISQYATLIFTLGDAVFRSGNQAFGQTQEPAPDADQEILKLVLANALVAEAGGHSILATRLFASCSRRTEVGLSEDVTLKNIQLMTLISMYLFHSDQEMRSWRIIGVAARLCIELGLHRAETYTTLFTSDDERDAALRLFWSIYVLDKRWSLGTGMMSALTDSDIDPKLEKPYESSPYLACMVDYSKIGSRVWSTFGNKEAPENSFNRNDAEYLNYQVLQWYKNIPENLTYSGPKHPDYRGSTPDNSHQGTRALYRLQVILYLRANQMRIVIYRPVLYSATSILSSDANPSARKVVDLAKDSVRTLSRISQTSDIYQRQQMCFNYFLTSALAVLFLAVSHAPAQFAASCRDEFYMALDLVRGLSAQSAVGERLWKTIRGLKEIGPKLGLYQRQSESERPAAPDGSNGNSRAFSGSVQGPQDAASSAAVAMAGLRAGRPVDEADFFSMQPSTSGNMQYGIMDSRNGSGQGTSPNGMANDLMSLFEAAGAFANNGSSSNSTSYTGESGGSVSAMGATPGGAAIGMAGGHEDDFGRILRDLF